MPTTKQTVLITGGAGYVGAASAHTLLAAGYRVVILDDLSTGKSDAIPNGASFIVGSYADPNRVADVIRDGRVDAILHCAARSIVAESVVAPERYYRENLVAGLALLDTALRTGVKQILLSSSAAVYGSAGRGPIDEEARLSPVNPYGATKVALEGALRFYAEAHGLRAVALRYFNVAGSTSKVSERHASETHLIPILVAAARSGETFKLFGDDYPTDDGSAVRDYVHVADVADAHVAALAAIAALPNERGLGAYLPVNIGSGRGTSVYEAIRAVERATGRTINVKVEARRPGDPARLVADVSRAAKALGWRPKRTTIAEIIKGVA